MNHSRANRFQDFFKESKYTLLKNYLYNYLLRKMAVEKSLRHENIKLILEVGQSVLYVACMVGCEDYAPLFVGSLVD
ncbi:MAG: hypothetical protein AUJ48_04000 [Deltaproteobacteria bacterium CG1_02_45_11]|nr:MAG: hypothetical protein AUJ48_04000 [Deltaproteobacteria bacterium CG1_02_45_11]